MSRSSEFPGPLSIIFPLVKVCARVCVFVMFCLCSKRQMIRESLPCLRLACTYESDLSSHKLIQRLMKIMISERLFRLIECSYSNSRVDPKCLICSKSSLCCCYLWLFLASYGSIYISRFKSFAFGEYL